MSVAQSRSQELKQYRVLAVFGLILTVIALLVVLLSAAASTQNEQTAPDPTTAPTTPPTTIAPGVLALGAEKTSAVEGFPVPAAATTTVSTATFESYEFPAGTTLDAVRSWYDAHLADGAAFKDFAWCKAIGSDRSDAIDRRWKSAGSSTIVSMSTTSHDGAPFVILSKNPPDGDGC